MQAFAYGHATDIAEALVEGRAKDTVFLAGGTELLNWLRLGIAKPARVIDIARLKGLAGVTRLPGGGLRIGAATRLNDVALNDEVACQYPVLAQAILKSASAQLRNLATIGGNPLQKTRCGYFRAEEVLPCNKRTPGSGCSALNGINDRHAIFGWNEACVATQPSDPATALAALDAVYVTEHRDGGRRIKAEELHTLPGAEAALECILVDEGLLNRKEFAVVRKTFDRRHFRAVCRRRKNHAPVHASAVQMDRAGAAFTEIATLLGARQLQMLAQQIKQCSTRINGDLVVAAVDAQCDGQMRTKFHALTNPAIWKRSRQTEHADLSA